ncbi:hypothetical protein [Paenibacillus dendrobii]|uniref:hypothetical protein n=1 Tax=Paenibacillus dendrobii TaxID=2691084 RepID=UPI001F3DD877|nr:hypothetical protein [Paenibacillus dendrobii]
MGWRWKLPPYPSIFKVVRESMPDAKLAAFSSWNPINSGIIESDIDMHKETANMPETASDGADQEDLHGDGREPYARG